MQDGPTPMLHVCVTCRVGPPPATEEPVRAGQLLFDRLSELAAGTGMQLSRVECLANCAHGCSAAITMAGKWSYLLGALDESKAADLVDYAASYARSKTGTVMPSRRAASLAGMIVGRIPSVLSV